MEALRHYKEKGRLDDWYSTIVDSARETAKAQTETQLGQPQAEDGEMAVEMSGALDAGGEEAEVPERRALRWV